MGRLWTLCPRSALREERVHWKRGVVYNCESLLELNTCAVHVEGKRNGMAVEG